MALSHIQNEGYRRSVGQPNKGSQPSGAIQHNAKATALGRNIRRGSTNTAVSSKSRGSMEGYDGGKSAYLLPNGAGYDAKAQHKARQPRIPKTLSGGNFDNPTSRLHTISKNVYDYSRRGQPFSSKRILAKMTKLNQMF